MRLFRSARWLLLALLLSVVPASSFAGIFISVGFAPPVLPVYEQPPCPEPGLMWTPGYWAYGSDGYYWVPGAWVPAPYEGALWTPGYWGWSGGLFVFHDGYWGRHVGYYGGVNYGFGYGGIGFAGGEWHGHDFAYNTAVVNVNRTVIHNTYINQTVVRNTTIVNNNRVAYSGGPGGIQHQPAPQERMAEREQHIAPTSVQQQHVEAARTDRTLYVKNNGGHPATLAVARPMTAANHAAPVASGAATRQGQSQSFNNNRPGASPAAGAQNRPMQQSRPASPAYQNQQARPAQQPNTQYQQRNSQPSQARPVQPSAPQSRPAPQQHAAPQSRPAPQQHAAPRAEPHERPK